MSLTRPSVSPNVRRAFEEGLSEFPESREACRMRAHATSEAVEVFTLTLDDVHTAAPIDHATPAGYRVIIGNISGALAGDVVQLDGGGPEMVGLSRDRLVATELRTIMEVSRRSDVLNQQDYELRILRIPGVLVEAFWLKAQNGQDLFVPVLSRAATLEPGALYPAADFFGRVQELAPRFRAFDSIDE